MTVASRRRGAGGSKGSAGWRGWGWRRSGHRSSDSMDARSPGQCGSKRRRGDLGLASMAAWRRLSAAERREREEAYVLKYLLFFSDNLGNPEISDPSYALGQRRFYQSSFAARDDFSSLTEEGKTRALVHAMVEILFLCGTGKRAVVAFIGGVIRGQKIDAALEGLSVESAIDFQKCLRICTFTSLDPVVLGFRW